MKEYDITYKEIITMRELLIQEMRGEVTTINTEVLKLVEMRLQTLIMARINKTGLEIEKKNFKQ